LINWHWVYRDFITAYNNGSNNWIENYKEMYLEPHKTELQNLHFEAKGFPNEAQYLTRIKQLGKTHFEDMILEIQKTDDYEKQVVHLTEGVLNQLHKSTVQQEVYVIVGLDCTNIYSVKFKNKTVTVICLESVKGSLEGLKLLLSHECHHWIRQLSFDYDLFESSTGERIITEGLASVFSEELIPDLNVSEYCYVPKSTVDWTMKNLLNLDNLILPNLGDNSLTSGLFSRTPSVQLISGMPPRVGYVYGYLKVKEYKENVNKNCVDLKNIKWEDVFYTKMSAIK
jgi:uncharacterized protein YjaZ